MSNDSSELEVSSKKSLKHIFKRSKRADFGNPAGVIIKVLAIFLVSQIIAVVVLQLFLKLVSSTSTSIDSSAPVEFVYVLIAEGLAAGFVFYIVKLRGLGLSSIGLGRKPNFGDLGRGLAGFASFYIILIAAAGILSIFFPDLNKGNQDVGFNQLNTTLDTFLAFFALVFLPPLGEEVLVRGYLYSGLRSRLKFLPAMLITSVLFAAAHLQSGSAGVLWAAGLNTFVLSLVLVYLRETTGALYAGMLVHMLNNLVAFGVHFHF